MTLTKLQIAKKIAEKTGQSQNKSIELLDQLIEIIKGGLENDNSILIAGFGKFSVKKKKERQGHNPSTGSKLNIPPHNVVRFKYSRKLKDKLNGDG